MTAQGQAPETQGKPGKRTPGNREAPSKRAPGSRTAPGKRGSETRGKANPRRAARPSKGTTREPRPAPRVPEARSKLDAYLKAHGWSRGRLSNAAGIDIRTVSALCDRKWWGNMQTWTMMARALGCGLDDICEVNEVLVVRAPFDLVSYADDGAAEVQRYSEGERWMTVGWQEDSRRIECVEGPARGAVRTVPESQLGRFAAE